MVEIGLKIGDDFYKSAYKVGIMKTKKEAETHKLGILKQLEKEPVIRQVDLASRLGLGVGTVNSYLKQLSKKDFINVKRVGQRQ